MPPMPQPRGFLPDAVTEDAVVLIKAGQGVLRLTYEIRLATYMAVTRGKRAIIVAEPRATLAAPLQAFVVEHGIEVKRSSR